MGNIFKEQQEQDMELVANSCSRVEESTFAIHLCVFYDASVLLVNRAYTSRQLRAR